MIIRRSLLVVWLAACLMSVLWGSPVSAQVANPPAPRFSVALKELGGPVNTERGFFTFTLNGGENASGGVVVTNTGASDILVDLRAVDSATAQGGGAVYADSGAAPSETGQWLQFDKPEISLSPGESTLVTFTIAVPAGVQAGQYLAGVSAQQAAEEDATTLDAGSPGQATAGVIVRSRYVVPVQVDVPGDWTTHVTITGINYLHRTGADWVVVTLNNDGSSFVRPTGSVVLTDASQNEIINQPIEMGTFISGTDATLMIPWPGGANEGDYQVEVRLDYGQTLSASLAAPLKIAQPSAFQVIIEDFTVTGINDENSGHLSYADVHFTIANPSNAINAVRVSLIVARNGETIDQMVLSDSITLPNGDATFNQRYYPPGAWEPGTYAVTVSIDRAVSEDSAGALQLSEATSADTIVVAPN